MFIDLVIKTRLVKLSTYVRKIIKAHFVCRKEKEHVCVQSDLSDYYTIISNLI